MADTSVVWGTKQTPAPIPKLSLNVCNYCQCQLLDSKPKVPQHCDGYHTGKALLLDNRYNEKTLRSTNSLAYARLGGNEPRCGLSNFRSRFTRYQMQMIQAQLEHPSSDGGRTVFVTWIPKALKSKPGDHLIAEKIPPFGPSRHSTL